MKPQQFGRYLLLDKVASGGMAEVWRGKLTGEQGFQRIYAIKKILPHVAEDQEFITMFTDEALITSSLQHANIGQVFEFNKIGDTFYLAMEYVSGKDLKSVWSFSRSRKQTIPVELSCLIVQKMAEGLDYAHRRTDNFGADAGIVHRDVSPQNVLLSWDGEVKVIDFGIAKASEKSGRTRPGTLKGKFAYMSPEQIRGLGLDGRADVFAIGVVLYELCTGERGFSADSEFSLLEMVRNVEIRPPTVVNRSLPAEVERIIYKSLAKDREHRYQTASELAEDLQRFLLSRGKAPGRNDLSKYLRENFTVDFEKERARLESYKEVVGEEVSEPKRTAPPRDADGQDHEDPTFSVDNVAQMVPDAHAGYSTADEEDDNFASSAPKPPPRPPTTSSLPRNVTQPPQSDTVAGRTPVNIAPPAPVPVQDNGGSGLKLFAAALGVTLVLAAGAIAAYLWVGRPTGTVVITVTGAPGAAVRFDDRPPARAEPSFTIDKVTPGTHTLVVEEAGFASFSTTIVTEPKTPLLQVKAALRRHNGRLRISSEPPGASVFLDGKELDVKTPTTLEVEGESTHEVRLQLEGYKEARRADVKVPATQEELVLLQLQPEKVRITIATTPPGATVAVNGAVIGTSPQVIERSPDDTNYPKVSVTMKGCAAKETTMPFDGTKVEQTFSINLTCK